MTFTGCDAVAAHPADSDLEVVSAPYDRSALGDAEWLGGSDPLEFNRRITERWIETGIHPDPRVYEVRRRTADPDIREFLILGHDAYITVEASEISWEIITDLPDW